VTEKTQNTRSSPVFREVLAEMMRERGIDPDVEERGVAELLPELEGCGFLGGVALASPRPLGARDDGAEPRLRLRDARLRPAP
jgi:hypothetical protein